MRVLMAYDSLSGNTKEVAEIAADEVRRLGHELDMNYATIEHYQERGDYDLYLLGSWTCDYGRTPPEMKEFIAELVEAKGKPKHVAVFGTGETQWGMDVYCGAVNRMAAFFNSRYPLLKIEQMPHSAKDTAAIQGWVQRVIAQREETLLS